MYLWRTFTTKFTVKGELTKHIKHVHEKKISYKCTICPKTYFHKCSLLLHTRRHAGEQHSKCPHCPYKADGSRDLNEHLKCHLTDGKYKCSECSASFTHRGGQRNHLRSIHKKVPEPLEPLVYKCSKCPREYKVASSRQRHEMTHDEIKNFKCFRCVAKFSNKAHWKRHVASHEDGKGWISMHYL